MFLETVADNCDVCQCTRLFKNAFKIKNTPERTVRGKPKARRLLGMASRRLSSPEIFTLATNKENGSGICTSPQAISPNKVSGSKKSRLPLEDFDPNSQDSGYGPSFGDREDSNGPKSEDGFQFAEPLGVPPRRMSVEGRSPMRSPQQTSSPSQLQKRSSNFFRSLSCESNDDGFIELIDLEALEENVQLPNDMGSLLSSSFCLAGQIESMECSAATTPEPTRSVTPKHSHKAKLSAIRRSLSLQNERDENGGAITPTLPTSPEANSGSKVRSCLFRSPNAASSTAKLTFGESPRNRCLLPLDIPVASSKSFKRPEPPTDASPVLVKRARKSTSFQDLQEALLPSPKPLLQRCLSESAAHTQIKTAITRSTTDCDLTGDFSRPCILPWVSGQHDDLKSISADTLVALMRGNFKDAIDSFTIVDCRYPYEFQAGHIEGALNLYTKELIEEQLIQPLTQNPAREPVERNILVFHCEFSFERGPNLSRFLRNLDRQSNKDHYPALHYPEIYLLHGGYERFYREQRTLCSPQGYRPMNHPENEADLRQFRSKSKSWQGDKSRSLGLVSRTNLKRLGL